MKDGCLKSKTFVVFLIMMMLSSCAGIDVGSQKEETPVFWPPPPQRPRIKYVGSLSGPSDAGIKGSWLKNLIDDIFGREGPGRALIRPYGVYAGRNRVYVTDPGIGVLHIFDKKEDRYLRIDEIDGGRLVSPIGIAVDEVGNIYLSDSVLKRVFVIDSKGRYLRDIGKKGLFLRPAGLAIDEGRVYVVDTHRHQVLVFGRTDGELLFTIGRRGKGEGEFNFPTNISISDDRVYVMDTLNFRVQIFSEDGGFISSFGGPGDGSGDFSKSKGIAVDSDGHIYVADSHFDCVQIFDSNGRFLLSFGGTGTRRGEMSLPAGVFIDESDKIYVADSYNGRVQIFQYLKEK